MAKAPKAPPAPPQEAAAGHNSGDAQQIVRRDRLAFVLKQIQADSRLLHYHHFRLIEAQKVIVKAAQDELKVLRKTAKTDGLVMADLDYMSRCASLEDPSIAPAEILRRAEIASWFALPVYFQPDMFADRAPLDERAYAEGVNAGLLGKDPVAPYDAASSAGQKWLQGWHEGQRQMREELGAAMARRNAVKAADEIIHGDGHDDPGFDPSDDLEAAE